MVNDFLEDHGNPRQTRKFRSTAAADFTDNAIFSQRLRNDGAGGPMQPPAAGPPRFSAYLKPFYRLLVARNSVYSHPANFDPEPVMTRRHLPLLLAPSLLLLSCVTTEADKQSLQKGFDSYSGRNLDDAEAAATRFIDANPASPNLDEAHYLRGLTRLTRGGSANRALAAEDLRTALQKSNRQDLKTKAARILRRIEGDTHFDADRWKEARAAYQEALAGASPTDTAYFNYRIGACLQAVGDWDAAEPYFKTVVADNADPVLTERSIARMYAKNFALQFGAFQERPRATELLAQLKQSSIPATVVTETREGRLLYIVRSGTYKTWHEADAARDKLQSKYPLVTIVP
jgi:tetratricopeptide (TPR) repeat protein